MLKWNFPAFRFRRTLKQKSYFFFNWWPQEIISRVFQTYIISDAASQESKPNNAELEWYAFNEEGKMQSN